MDSTAARPAERLVPAQIRATAVSVQWSPRAIPTSLALAAPALDAQWPAHSPFPMIVRGVG